MKKLSALLLTTVIMLSFSACSNNNDDESSFDGINNEVIGDNDNHGGDTDEDIAVNPLEGTMLLAAFGVLEEDTFALEMQNADIEVVMYKDTAYNTEDVYMHMIIGESLEVRVLLTGGNLCVMNKEEMTYFLTEMNQEQFDRLSSSFTFIKNTASSFADGNTIFIDSSVADFMGKQRFYEEFLIESGDTFRAFFDGEALVGLMYGDEETELFISGTLPERAYDVLAGYEEIEFDQESFDMEEVFGILDMFG